MMTQRRVCDYIVEIDHRGANFRVANPANNLIREFETQDELIDYLNNC
jgi:hypothetical protein